MFWSLILLKLFELPETGDGLEFHIPQLLGKNFIQRQAHLILLQFVLRAY